MLPVQIKKATINDITKLQAIAKQTFYETFSSGNTEDNMKKYLEEGFNLEKLSAELSNINSEFYFATLDNKIIGYLKLNSGNSQTEIKNIKAVEIERIYVLQQYHGKGWDNYFIIKHWRLPGIKMRIMYG